MNIAPKLNYQEFVKDIYNGLKKINVQYEAILSKLGEIETRMSAIETSQIYLGTKLEEMKNEPDASPSAAAAMAEDKRLLSLLDQLESEPELPAIYKYTSDVLASKAEHDVLVGSGGYSGSDDMSSSLASYSSTSPSAHEELSHAPGTLPSGSGFLILED